MHPLFQDIPQVECFIDDIGIFINSSFHQHLSIVKQVLLRLEESGFTVNPIKCAWAVQATDNLGFLLTTEGTKPLPAKIEAISRIARPTAPTHVRSFVGLINGKLYISSDSLQFQRNFSKIINILGQNEKSEYVYISTQ